MGVKRYTKKEQATLILVQNVHFIRSLSVLVLSLLLYTGRALPSSIYCLSFSRSVATLRDHRLRDSCSSVGRSWFDRVVICIRLRIFGRELCLRPLRIFPPCQPLPYRGHCSSLCEIVRRTTSGSVSRVGLRKRRVEEGNGMIVRVRRPICGIRTSRSKGSVVVRHAGGGR
jgi:hypothetical protein